MDLSAYIGKRISLWLVDDADDNIVYGGWTAHLEGEELVLVRTGGRIVVDHDWVQRIMPIQNQTSQQILDGAEYVIRLSIGALPDSKDVFEYLRTGLKWPTSETLAPVEE